MITYGIPPVYHNGFKAISALNENDTVILSDILRGAKLGEGPKLITSKNATKLHNDTEELELMVRSLISLIGIYTESDSLEKFALDFSDSFRELVEGVDDTMSSNLNEKLLKLLPNLNTITITKKAQDLILETNYKYVDGRVISDIRVVYDDKNMEDENQYALIVHNLRLNCIKGNDSKDLFISLNSTELIELKDVIERAINKDEIIRRNNPNLSFIDLS